MVIDFRERTNPWLEQETRGATTDEEAHDAGRLSAEQIIDRVNEILGYDILEESLMAEGYVELGAEMLSISESTLSAQIEHLPE